METLGNLLGKNKYPSMNESQEIQTTTQTSSDFKDRFYTCVPQEYDGIDLSKCNDLPSALVDVGYKWVNAPKLKSLLIYGTFGSGKTTFSIALAIEARRKYCQFKYFWPNFITGANLYEEILLCQRDRGVIDLAKYLDSDLLLIDDIDKVDTSGKEFFRMQVFKIIDHRHSSNLPTIITTNLSPNDFSKNFDPSIISRTNDKSKWITIKFPDKDIRKEIEPDYKF